MEEEFFILLLTNAGPHMSAGNKNLETGAGSVLSEAGMKLARENWGKRVNANNKPILTLPNLMLIPPELETDAISIRDDEFFGISDTSAGGKRSGARLKNQFRGWNHRKSSYLSNTAIKDSEGNDIPNQSSTGWYQFVTGSATIEPIVLALLNGNNMPVIETDSMVFNKLGVEARSYHDFGFAFGDVEGVLKMDGA